MAMAMPDVLRLYFGESTLPTPAFIKDAAARALADGFTYYSENAGLPTLREALAAQYRRLHEVELDPGSEIVVTASGVQALHLGIRSLLDPGDEALCLTPAWPNGAAIVGLANATPIEIPHVLVGERYVVDFEALEAAVTPRTRLLHLHVAVEPARLGRDRRGAGSSARIRAPARPVAARGRGLRTALLPHGRARHGGSVDPAQGNPGGSPSSSSEASRRRTA